MATSNFIREMVGAWLHRGANIGEGYFSLFVTNRVIPGQEGRAGSLSQCTMIIYQLTIKNDFN
ncbi:MAG TPA: hypothetical protein VHR47_06360 [Bacillota bacterium]|nr:hypothetical protein [Bacillota bacterium]